MMNGPTLNDLISWMSWLSALCFMCLIANNKQHQNSCHSESKELRRGNKSWQCLSLSTTLLKDRFWLLEWSTVCNESTKKMAVCGWLMETGWKSPNCDSWARHANLLIDSPQVWILGFKFGVSILSAEQSQTSKQAAWKFQVSLTTGSFVDLRGRGGDSWG